MALRRKFETKRNEVSEDCRKLHNEELRNLYSSPSKVRLITSIRMVREGMQHEWDTSGMHIVYWLEPNEKKS
jgi:hypothetical protein